MGPPPLCGLKVPHVDTNPQWDATWRWAFGSGGESAMRVDLHHEISALGRKDPRDSLSLPHEDMVRHPLPESPPDRNCEHLISGFPELRDRMCTEVPGGLQSLGLQRQMRLSTHA